MSVHCIGFQDKVYTSSIIYVNLYYYTSLSYTFGEHYNIHTVAVTPYSCSVGNKYSNKMHRDIHIYVCTYVDGSSLCIKKKKKNVYLQPTDSGWYPGQF